MTFVPDHMSFSQLNQYEQCPRSYFLARVKRAEERPTWYLPLGKAVHASIEWYLSTGVVPDFEDSFYPLVAEQMKIDPDHAKWLAGGPEDNPFSGDRAVKLGKDCVAKAVEFLKDMEVHYIEFDATGLLPGCEVPIKAFIDLLGVHKKHGPVIVDWKSSSKKPTKNTQLETYRALTPDFPYVKGLWVMLRPGASVAQPIDLTSVDPGAMGARYQKAYEAIKAGVWKTQAGYMCKWCTQKDNCILKAGPTDRARYYDTAERDGFPF